MYTYIYVYIHICIYMSGPFWSPGERQITGGFLMLTKCVVGSCVEVSLQTSSNKVMDR